MNEGGANRAGGGEAASGAGAAGIRQGWVFVDIEAAGQKARLWAAWTATPDGLAVQIYGGSPHLGAVAVAYPRPSLRDPPKPSATSSVLTRLGHLDDLLARPASELLAKALGVPVAVVAGVHVGPAGTFQAPAELTEELVRAVPRLAAAVVEAVRAAEAGSSG